MDRASEPTSGTLGTFAGVFTPSILTILGIILFLRLGYVVGEAGLVRALLIMALANAITVLTSLSLSAIATNLHVKGGGDYYIISRTLGPAFGGALGLVLYLAQAVSIAFYCIGFGEAVLTLLPPAWELTPRMTAAMAVTALFVLAWAGADWATRFQYGVMVLLVAALGSFYVGAFEVWSPERVQWDWRAPEGGLPFWVVFAIFFPAVTGFSQGVSMSGDLRDPGRSIPVGTFLAVGISLLVYFSMALLFAGALPAEVLRTDYAAMKSVSRMGALIDGGVIAATLSSAMASFMGAPRILQSLAGDRIFGALDPFAVGAGRTNNPRRAVLLSLAIAYAVVALGNLNLIAPVVSMFFLVSYGLLNFATYYEASTASPSFRPRFRYFRPRLCLLGALACLGAMLAIDWRSSVVALSILFAVFQYVRRTAGPARWADSRRSHYLQTVRSNLMKAAREPEHDRDWRPYILAFNNRPEYLRRLMALSTWLEGGSGMSTLVQVVEGTGVEARARAEAAQQEIQKVISREGFTAFPLAVNSEDIETGVHHLVQIAGIGPIRTNTALANWGGDTLREEDDNQLPTEEGWRELLFGQRLQVAFRRGCHALVLATDEERWRDVRELEQPRIDVWWRNDATGRLMLLLADLIMRHDDWSEGCIRVLATNESLPGTPDADGRLLADRLDEYRIEGEPVVLPKGDLEEVQRETRDSALLFLPFQFRKGRIELPWEGPNDEILRKLPTVVMVDAAHELDLDAEPEEGRAAELAAIRDGLAELQSRLEKAREETTHTNELVERSQASLSELLRAESGSVDLKAKKTLEGEVEHAEEQAEKSRRRALKLEAKLKLAQKEAEEQGVPVEDEPEQEEADTE